MTEGVRRMRSVLAAAAVAALASACGGGDSGAPPGLSAEAPAPLSIVVIGDSIASGEGIAYGYAYDTAGGYWTGGVKNPQWQGEYQLCHDTPQAYGDVVATMVGATLAKFACTGSTYDNGIVFERRSLPTQDNPVGATYRPAQFGNWLGGTQLNAAYDAAKPDVVIVTLGADDVSFADILHYCILGTVSSNDTAALVRHPERSRILREEVRQRLLDARALPAQSMRAAATSSDHCTSQNPGWAIERLFWDPIDSGRLAGNYRSLVAAIKARGAQAGKVPKIVFTTYHQPLPNLAPSTYACEDSGFLSSDKISYLISLEVKLQATLIEAVRGLDGVTVADISGVIAGHEWCTSDPWAYGLTVLVLNLDSLAPSHPTPAGQAAIAAVVKAALPAR
jgi:hypothetical protein